MRRAGPGQGSSRRDGCSDNEGGAQATDRATPAQNRPLTEEERRFIDYLVKGLVSEIENEAVASCDERENE